MRVKSYCGICRSKTSYLIQRRHYSLLVGISPSDKQRVSTREKLAARWHCMTTLLRRYQLDYNVPCSGSFRCDAEVVLTNTLMASLRSVQLSSADRRRCRRVRVQTDTDRQCGYSPFRHFCEVRSNRIVMRSSDVSLKKAFRASIGSPVLLTMIPIHGPFHRPPSVVLFSFLVGTYVLFILLSCHPLARCPCIRFHHFHHHVFLCSSHHKRSTRQCAGSLLHYGSTPLLSNRLSMTVLKHLVSRVSSSLISYLRYIRRVHLSSLISFTSIRVSLRCSSYFISNYVLLHQN